MDGDLLGCLSISVGPSGLAIKASSVRLSVRLASTSTLPQARKPCMPCHSCHAQDFTQELSAPITSNHLQQVMNIPAASAFNFPRLQKLCRFAACFVQIFSTSHGVQNGMLALVSSIVSIPETLCFSHLYMQYTIYLYCISSCCDPASGADHDSRVVQGSVSGRTLAAATR